MEYVNGKDVLPTELLEQIQNYLDGAILYIPKKDERASWGELSGSRDEVRRRNNEIVRNYRNGYTIERLTDLFCLSRSSIKKIIYSAGVSRTG